METKFGVGESTNENPFEAGKEAAKKAFEKAGIEECDFVLAFGTIGYDQEKLIKGIQSITEDAPLAGGSTEGIITHAGPNEDLHAVNVMVAKGDTVRFSNVFAKGVKEDSEKAGKEAAKKLEELGIEDPLALMIFPEGYSVNVEAIFRGLKSGLKKNIPFVGGLTGEDFSQGYTFQYHNGEVFKNGFSCVMVSGKSETEIKVNHGCIPLGVGKKVTKAEGNKIYEIDGKKAYDVFIDYLPEDKKENYKKATVSLCLGFKSTPEAMKQGYPEYFIRYVAELNKEEGYLGLQSEIKEGTEVYVMYRDKDRMLEGIEKVTMEIKDKIKDKKPKIVFDFSCAGRGKMIFTPEERKRAIDIRQEELGKEVPWIGQYCFGEIAPLGDKNYFHNYTVVLFVIY